MGVIWWFVCVCMYMCVWKRGGGGYGCDEVLGCGAGYSIKNLIIHTS